jgi:hypothetical protein
MISNIYQDDDLKNSCKNILNINNEIKSLKE